MVQTCCVPFCCWTDTIPLCVPVRLLADAVFQMFPSLLLICCHFHFCLFSRKWKHKDFFFHPMVFMSSTHSSTYSSTSAVMHAWLHLLSLVGAVAQVQPPPPLVLRVGVHMLGKRRRSSRGGSRMSSGDDVRGRSHLNHGTPFTWRKVESGWPLYHSPLPLYRQENRRVIEKTFCKNQESL